MNKHGVHELVGRGAKEAKIRNGALGWTPAACSVPHTSMATSQLGPSPSLHTACFWACGGSAIVLTMEPLLQRLQGPSPSLRPWREGF